MKTVKISSLDTKGNPKSIYHHLPQECLPELVRRMLEETEIGMVVLEQEEGE